MKLIQLWRILAFGGPVPHGQRKRRRKRKRKVRKGNLGDGLGWRLGEQ